jgi:thiamine thiazole synthase
MDRKSLAGGVVGTPRVLREADISRALIGAYHGKLSDRVVGDVVVVGAGPSGLVAATALARRGLRVTLLEKRLAPGGGIWGGAMGMNDVVVEDRALVMLEENGVRYRPVDGGLYVSDAVELASALCLGALRSGVVLLNLTFAEDLCVHRGRVTGVVANRSTLGDTLPVDPIALEARAVVDATGHDAALVQMLSRRQLLEPPAGAPGEGAMDAAAGESFVVDRVAEPYPGLWMCGMCVVAALGGPRMGPIFGGMLLSGKRVADLISDALGLARDPGMAEG